MKKYPTIPDGTTIIVKAGTGTLFTEEDGRPIRHVFESLAREAKVLWEKHKIHALFVSSGAIAAGRYYENLNDRNPSRFSEPVLAGIGAMMLLTLWSDAAEKQRMPVCQVLVTYGSLLDPEKQVQIRSTIRDALQNGALVVMNENDPVSDAEIVLKNQGVSDNDLLTSKIASVINPQGVLFLSEIGGVYETDPRVDPKARKFQELDARTIPASLLVPSAPSACGKGGIPAKLKAASDCLAFGPVAIAGFGSTLLYDYVKGEPTAGTRIGSENILK